MTCSSPAAPSLLKDGEPAIVNAAKDAGLNMKKLAADVKRKDVRAEVDADIAEGQRIGVQGTPYFLINNLVARGALSSDLFKEAINMALQGRSVRAEVTHDHHPQSDALDLPLPLDLSQGTSVTVGNFDGVHLGHQALLAMTW